jgi:hypothetical protein
MRLPEGSRFRQDELEQATLRWTPGAEQVGPMDLRLALFDEGGDVVTTDIRVTVCGAVFDARCRDGLVAALFGGPPGACGSDPSGDGALSAADLAAVAGHNQTCVPDNG